MNTEQRKSRKVEPSSNSTPSWEGLFSVTGVSKEFLEAWLLLLLKTWSAHGYALAEILNRVGFAGVDHTRIYRQLRSLEQRGLVVSSWDGSSNGPAKRVYKLTAAGEEFLSGWAQALRGYSTMLEAFGNLYTGAFKSLFVDQTGEKTEFPKKEGGKHNDD